MDFPELCGPSTLITRTLSLQAEKTFQGASNQHGHVKQTSGRLKLHFYWCSCCVSLHHNDMSLWLSLTKPDLFQGFLSKLKIVPVNQLKWLSKLDGILEELPGFSWRCEFSWIVGCHGENLAPKQFHGHCLFFLNSAWDLNNV